ncbi:hypothetical protein [Streptomyces sp. NPDC101132]|uniref:hypothetical protein n=1 Tax=Streptomyces sp. NPDC101132 TaxID=3366110 RepID=UPI003825CD55
MSTSPVDRIPDGPTRRARAFIGPHGVRVAVKPVDFEAGREPTAVPYAFMVGPAGEFGIQGYAWAPLHATAEGRVESVALPYDASPSAKQVTRLVGDEVDGVDLSGHEPPREVRGLADTWWRGPDSLVALYTGEATAMASSRGRVAPVHSGLDDRRPRGNGDADA